MESQPQNPEFRIILKTFDNGLTNQFYYLFWVLKRNVSLRRGDGSFEYTHFIEK